LFRRIEVVIGLCLGLVSSGGEPDTQHIFALIW
jgi:hypothetical protein